MWLFSHPFKSLPPDPQGASCWCAIPKKSPWDVLGPLLPPLLGCVIQEEPRPVWWATLINIPPFSPISSSTRMMDFLLSELHGLIKRNPRRKQIFFPLFPRGFSCGGKRNTFWREKQKWGILGTFLCKTCWEIGWERATLGMIIFFAPQPKSSFLLCPGFWNCLEFVGVETGTRRELLENHVHTHTELFCNRETFVLQLNPSVWAEVLCRKNLPAQGSAKTE